MSGMITSKSCAALLTGLLALCFGLTAADAAPSPASPGMTSAAKAAPDAISNVSMKRHPGPRHLDYERYEHRERNEHFAFRSRPFRYGFAYRPYHYYTPPCGWRKRCWYDNWGIRRCRWVNTCRRY